MGARRYTTAVDVWSVGCIFAELLGRKILFQAQGPIEQVSVSYCCTFVFFNNNLFFKTNLFSLVKVLLLNHCNIFSSFFRLFTFCSD